MQATGANRPYGCLAQCSAGASSAHPLAAMVWVKEVESPVRAKPIIPAMPTPAPGLHGEGVK